MKYLFGAIFALTIAAPAAAAQSPAQGHDGPRQQSGQHGEGHRDDGRHRPGEGHDCPCCRPGADGQRPACCARMHQEHGAGHGGDRGHDDH